MFRLRAYNGNNSVENDVIQNALADLRSGRVKTSGHSGRVGPSRVRSGHEILTRAKVNFFINLPNLDPKKFLFSNHHYHK